MTIIRSLILLLMSVTAGIHFTLLAEGLPLESDYNLTEEKGKVRMPPRNPFVIEADYTDGVLSAPSLASDDATAAIVVTDAATDAITFSAEVPAISLGSGICVGVYNNFYVTITLSTGASFSGSYGL